MDEAAPLAIVKQAKNPHAWRYRRTIAAHLKLLRGEKQLSIAALAHQTHLSASYLHRVESLAHSMSMEDAAVLADALECTLDYLAGRAQDTSRLGETIQRNSIHDWILLGMLLDTDQRAAVLNWYKSVLRRPLVEAHPFFPPDAGANAYA